MMYRNTLKLQFSLAIVVSHIAIFLVAVYFELHGAFGEVDLFTVLAALIPLFGLFTTLIVKDTLSNQYNRRRGRKVNAQMVWITRLILVAYICACLSTFYLFRQQVITTASGLSEWIARIEAALGVTLGLIVDDLFGGDSTDK